MNLLPPEHMEKLVAQLKRHEGAKRNKEGLHIAYRCPAGALTIGYGHNLDANPVPGLGVGSTITEQRACEILTADIATMETKLNRPDIQWIKRLDHVRHAVLINMAFNLGIAGLLGFSNTLTDIRAGRYASAANRMMQSKWARQVGDGPGGRFDRAEELAAQMRTGQWQF